MQITTKMRPTEMVHTVDGDIAAEEWCRQECQRIKGMKAWRKPEVIKQNDMVWIEDETITIKLINNENTLVFNHKRAGNGGVG